MKYILWILILSSAVLHLNSCAGIQQFVYPGADWTRKTAANQALHPDELDAALDGELEGKGDFTSITIVRNGYLVYEKFQGMQPGEMTAIYSATKSINSLVTGVAIDRGIIKDEFQTIGSYFPDYETADPLILSVTLRDILTMRTGIDYDEWKIDYDDPDNPYQAWLDSEDRTAFILKQPMAEAPGNVFRYQTPASQLLTRAAEEASGKDFVSLAGELLFEPLGIPSDRYIWRLDSSGHARVAACNMVPSDLARIGLLILRHGVWKGKRIVSEKWLEDSLKPSVTIRYGVEFGYHWWLRSYADCTVIGAEGYGGQCMFIVPEKDTVIVVTGDFPEGPDGAFRFVQDLVLDRL